MSVQIISPPPSLKNYIRYFFALNNETEETSRKDFTVMCSGEPGLIFQQDPTAITGFNGEHLPQLFIFGQATNSGQLSSTGIYHTTGLSFHPSALKYVFNLNAKELTNHHIGIDDIIKTSITEQLFNARSVQEQARYLFDFISKRTLKQNPDNGKINHALDAIRLRKKLPEVLTEINLTERSLERLFLTHIGITPILYSRICRFQSSLRLLKDRNLTSLTDIAHKLDYFDQSHFIRDFKNFAGISPGTYQRNAVEQLPGFPEWERK